MIKGQLINIYGEMEQFYYTLEVFRKHELDIYCMDKGKGAFIIIDMWYAEDDSQYQVWGYLDGDLLNQFDKLNYDCYGDILITRTRFDGLPISIDEEHIMEQYEDMSHYAWGQLQ